MEEVVLMDLEKLVFRLRVNAVIDVLLGVALTILLIKVVRDLKKSK